MAPPAPDREAAGTEALSHFTGVVAIRQLQDELSAEAQMLRRFMSTNACQQLLTLIFCKGNLGRFWARHIDLLWAQDTGT